MRSAWLVGLIAGCGFSSSGLHPGDPGGTDGVDGGSAGSAPSRCDVSNPSLRLCLTFDRNVVQDLVTPPHEIAEASGVAAILRIASDAAARLDGGSRIRFQDSPDFDVRDLTIDMWIDPDPSQQHTSFSMIDNHLQYAVSYEQDHHVQCTIGTQLVASAIDLAAGWHHVACRYDANKRELRVYADGNVAGCISVSAIPTIGNTGIAIGASYDGSNYQNNFIGSLDGLHLYAGALPDGDICRAAGRSACSTRCPGSDVLDPG